MSEKRELIQRCTGEDRGVYRRGYRGAQERIHRGTYKSGYMRHTGEDTDRGAQEWYTRWPQEKIPESTQ